MTLAGARGETERQMANTLHYELPQSALHPSFNALDRELRVQRRGTSRRGEPVLPTEYRKRHLGPAGL